MGQKLSKIKENFIFLVQNCPPQKKSQKEKIASGEAIFQGLWD